MGFLVVFERDCFKKQSFQYLFILRFLRWTGNSIQVLFKDGSLAAAAKLGFNTW